MKNKIIAASLIFLTVFTLTACNKVESNKEEALKFKEDYESLNGKTNSAGKEHRTLAIKEDNPYVFTSADKIVEKIEKGETFYVYFGSKLCPWCRSVIEKSIEVAKEKGIKKIYYVDIWDNEGNEILRDKYSLDENKEAKQSIKGPDSYYKLLDHFKALLPDYTLTDEEGNEHAVGEKRIFAPTFIYVKEGTAKAITDGTSDKQKDARATLTKELLNDEEQLFTNFFEAR
ncbi:MAG: hypothetical protein PHN72_01440 [Bacilli bacterium]|nr:hypothetical protein [Bacilli bacterium]